MMKDPFVVIGAGASGITAAVTLAKHAYPVVLIEAAGRIGPLLRGFERRGMHFDTGFHYAGGLGDGEILDLFFRYLGVHDKVQKIPFDPEGFDLLRFTQFNSEIPFPYGYDRIRERLCDAFPGERNAIEMYLNAVRESFRSRPYLNLDQEMRPLQGLKSVHGPSLKEKLDSLSENPHLKRVLSAHCYLHGAAVGEVAFEQHAAVVGSYYESVHGLYKGGTALVQAFEKSLSDHGVRVLCGHRVSGIEFSASKRPQAVRLDNGERISCHTCIVSIHPRQMLDLVPEGLFKPSYVRRLKNLEESFSAFLLYGASRKWAAQGTGRNLIVFPYTREENFLERRPLNERPLFISSAASEAESAAAQGFTAICPSTLSQTMAWTHTRPGRRPPGYRHFKRRILEMLKCRIQASCPEFREDLEIIDGATPLTLRDFSNNCTGSLYGAKHRVGQYNPTPLTRMEGLYLTGQSTVAPGVLGAMISAFLTCGAILGHNNLRRELMACR